MLSHVLYYIVTFEIIALDKKLLAFAVICYHTAALPINKRL